MHIYVLARGLISELKKWENFMSSQYLPMEVLEKGKKKPTPYLAQLQVREVKMYEIICPKGEEDKVLGMIKPTTNEGFGGKWGKMVTPLRKLLGLKPISKTWKPHLLPTTEGISLIALGTKDDKQNWIKRERNDFSDHDLTPHEML